MSELVSPVASQPPAGPETFCLALVDLDGTALTHDSRLSDRNARALRAAADAGALVVFASSRPPRSMRVYHEELGLQTPLIAYNGALVVDAFGPPIFRRPIPAATARHALAQLRRHCPNANVSVECDDLWHIDRIDDGLRSALTRYRIVPPHTEGRVNEIVEAPAPGVMKFFILISELAPVTLDELQQLLGPEVWAAASGDIVDIVARGITKATGAAALCAHLGIDPAHAIAFGNDYNDIPLLQFAGHGVAVANAPEAVRVLASQVAPLADDDGVAAVLEELAERGILCSPASLAGPAILSA
jgi:Cof subfamily protein (haloacid dehalogenase superfamily)